MSNYILAIVMAILAYGMLSFGNALQKKGATELPAIETTTAGQNVKNFMKNPKWLVGYMLGNVQIVFYWIALANGPISLVTPMAGAGMIVLVACSSYYLHERISRAMLAGICLTVAGIVLIGASTTGDEPQVGYLGSLDVFVAPITIVFFIMLVAGAIITAGIDVAFKYKHADILFGLAAGFAQSIGNIASKFFTAGFDSSDLVQILGRWPLYFFLGFLLGGNISAMVTQQVGYQKGKIIVVNPIVNVMAIILPAIAGIVMFGEWNTYTAAIIGVKIVAMTMLLLGVVALSLFNARIETRATHQRGSGHDIADGGEIKED
jgi:drug/metabolite transporter (DMT)-like permease